MTKPNTTKPMRVIEETPEYWRVLFDYPPFNIVDADVFQALQDLLVRMETTETLRVVVFESALADFYLSHFDLTGRIGNIMSAIGPTGLPILMDTFVRLTKAPVVSLARIRGCVRGVSSEFVLACDMRFASRENTKLGHPELGVGLHPGGGGTERLPYLVGRGRALEIVLSANDFDGDTAERYGYVNRSLPDGELDAFVESLATRIASFDKRAISETKRFVDVASLPPDYEIAPEWDVCLASIMRPAAQERIKKLMERGFHKPGDVEERLGYHVGRLGR